MGHLLLIQVQLFSLKKLKAAGDQQKHLYHLIQHILNILCFIIFWTPGKASCKKTNSLATSEASCALSLDIVVPATENTCSDGKMLLECSLIVLLKLTTACTFIHCLFIILEGN